MVKKACNQKTMLCATDGILKTHLSLDRVLIDCEVTGGYVSRGGRGGSLNSDLLDRLTIPHTRPRLIICERRKIYKGSRFSLSIPIQTASSSERVPDNHTIKSKESSKSGTFHSV